MMNVIEILVAPDLLLWGPLNGFFAALFIVLVLVNGFVLPPQTREPFKRTDSTAYAELPQKPSLRG